MKCDPVRPLKPNEKQPVLGVGQGIGVMLLHNTRPDDQGRFFATRWVMVLLPLFPLGRHHVRKGRQYDTGDLAFTGTATEYHLLGRSRMRLVEILRTYLMFWVVLPVMVVGPIIAGIALQDPNSWDSDENMPQATAVSILMFGVFLAGFLFYRSKLRPVRHPCE